MSDPVVGADVSWLRVPLASPIADSTHRLTALEFVVLELSDAAGKRGTSYLLGLDYATPVLVRMVEDAARKSIGRSPSERTAVWADLHEGYEYIGRTGVASWGLAAVDLAMWDLFGHQTGLSVVDLLGSARSSAPVYGSGGWLTYSVDELLAEAAGYLDRGLGGYKMKVGRGVREDANRVRAVRSVLGDTSLMIDANQGFSLFDATILADLVEDLEITWFEEPLRGERLEDFLSLRARSTVRVAMGERAYLPDGLCGVIDARAVDVVMPDAARIGGVRGWLSAAAHAAVAGIEVSPHYYREFDAALVCATPAATFVENFFWTESIFEWDARIANGRVTPPQEPGFGVHLRPSARAEHLVMHVSVGKDD